MLHSILKVRVEYPTKSDVPQPTNVHPDSRLSFISQMEISKSDFDFLLVWSVCIPHVFKLIHLSIHPCGN